MIGVRTSGVRWCCRAAALLAAALLLVPWLGCQLVLDAKERKLDPSVMTGDPCSDYCTTVMANCTGANAQYVSPTVCRADCGHFPLGELGATIGNSVACRMNQAVQAGTTGEPIEACLAAGPASNVCGTTCESYCSLVIPICTTAFSGVDACLAACQSMKDLQEYATSSAADQRGDTVQCRIFHVSAATQNAPSHCPHSGAMVTKYCVDPADGAAPWEASTSCDVAVGASACDVCQAQHCCTQKNDCYNDPICGTADVELDTCVATAEMSDAGASSCYETFVTTGPFASAIQMCKKTQCAVECGVP